MKITCLSCSNVENARDASASTHACEIVRDVIQAQAWPDTSVEIVRLIDYGLQPCRMCGKCFSSERCTNDPAFNQVLEKMIAADAVFVVCPHYAPFPSKVMALLEKMEEMVFLRSTADPNYRFPLYKKPVGIIAHGGQGDEALAYYRDALVEPLAMGFASAHMKIVGAGEADPHGVTFGIRSLAPRKDSIFVDIEHDWPAIQARIEPLVTNVGKALTQG